MEELLELGLGLMGVKILHIDIFIKILLVLTSSLVLFRMC